jgi:hypothetical protein
MNVVEVLLTIILVWLVALLIVLSYFVMKLLSVAQVFLRMGKRVLSGFTLSFGFGKK